jgi:serine/threonine protein kinase/tetratricopeptide (TPR) repeat protein
VAETNRGEQNQPHAAADVHLSDQSADSARNFETRGGPGPTPEAASVPPSAVPENRRGGPELLAAGQPFGRYVVVGKLGQGGMGSVYLCHDTQLDRKVALKIPFFEADERATQIERFIREARSMARIQHAGICPVFDVGEIDGLPFLSMAYIRGSALATQLNGTDPLPIPRTTRLLRSVALAIQTAHENGIIHRDLKPANIMLTPEDEPIVMDFGLARPTKLGDAGLTHRSDIVGSPSYMSPEQVEARQQDLGPWTDVWALGVMLFELLTGRRPFTGSTIAVFGRIVQSDPPRFVEMEVDVPPELEAICRRALQKKIQQRTPTALQFAAELASYTQSSTPSEIALGLDATIDLRGPFSKPSSQLTHSRRSRAAELRQVTLVLFDRESLNPTQDMEAQQESYAAFRAAISAIIEQFGGVVLPESGEEVIACFGFPSAYEDAAARALRAALSVLRSATSAASSSTAATTHNSTAALPPPAQIAVVVHSGAVIAECRAEENDKVTLSGEARSTLTRLKNVSEPGQVVLSAITRQLVGPLFITESLGEKIVRGLPQPLELLRIIREAGARNRVELVDPGNLTPLIGRDGELGMLKERWERASDGQRQVVEIIGEAGLGKSRLIREIRQHVQKASDEAAVIELRCSQFHESTGFYPVIDYLSRLLDLENLASGAERLSAVQSYFSQFGIRSGQQITLLADLLSLPLNGQFPPLNLTPQRQRELTVQLLLDWLRELAERRATVLIVEDLHWVDPTTLELITAQLSDFDDSHLLMILTSRPEFQQPWRGVRNLTQITLSRLTHRQTGDMLQRRVGRRDIAPAIVQQVAQRTDGVPLFVEEFAALLVESGELERATPHGILQTAIPATLQDLLLARLDRMASNPDVVQLAATIGREFSYTLLAAACELPEAELREEIGKLVRAELLFQKGQMPDAQFIFKHALLQDSAYQSLLKKRRQDFHAKIATTLETRFTDIVESSPELLAHHFTAAGQAKKALEYWLKAGQKAQASSAVKEAIASFERGLALIATMPESSIRDSWELRFQMPYGAVLVQRRGYAAPEPGAAFSRARHLCQQLGQNQMLSFVLAGQWGWHLVRAELSDCLRLATEMVQLGELLQDVGLMVEACWAMTCTLFYLGRFSESAEYCHRGVELFEQHPNCTQPFMAVTGQNAGVTLRGYGALALFCLGRRAEAVAMSAEAIALAGRTNDPFSLSMALFHGGWLKVWCGDFVEVQSITAQALALCRQSSFEFYETLDRINLACASLIDPASTTTQLTEQIEQCRQAIAAYSATGGQVMLPHAYGLLGQTLTKLGQLDAAESELARARAAQTRSGERFFDAELQRLQAELEWARGDRAAAQKSLAQAERIAQQQLAAAWLERIEQTRQRQASC